MAIVSDQLSVFHHKV